MNKNPSLIEILSSLVNQKTITSPERFLYIYNDVANTYIYPGQLEFSNLDVIIPVSEPFTITTPLRPDILSIFSEAQLILDKEISTLTTESLETLTWLKSLKNDLLLLTQQKP